MSGRTKILVTGGYGFIGRHVCVELERRGYTPVVLDHRRISRELPAYPAILGDVRDGIAIDEAMAYVDGGWIHLAGVLGTQETVADPLPALLTNIKGGLNVLRAAAKYGLPGVNIGVGNWWMENTYAISKSTVERLCRMYRNDHQLAVATVRAMNAYGPTQSVAAPYGSSKVRKIVPSFVMRALHGDPIQIYGDGSSIMDMVHVRDVAYSLVSHLEGVRENPGEWAADFEVGTCRPTTVAEIAEMVIGIVGQGKVEYLEMRPGEEPGATVMASPEKVKFLGPGQMTPLEYGLAETVTWYRAEYGL